MIFEKFKKDMEGREITKQEGSLSLLIFGGIFQCALPLYFNRYYNFNFGSFIFLMKRNSGVTFFDIEEYFDTTKASFYKFLKTGDKKDLPEYNDFLSIFKKANQLYQNNPPEKIAKINDEKLEALIKESFDLFGSIFASTVFCESLDEDLVHKFYKEIEGEKKEFNNFFNFGSKMGFESFAVKIDESLLSLKKNNDFYQCQWILSNYYICPDLNETETSIRKSINEKGGFEKIKEELDKISKETLVNREEIEIYRNSILGNEEKLFNYMQLCIHLRDVRKEPILKLITAISNLAREIFKRAGINKEDVVYGFYDDFMNGFYKKDNYINEINKRKEGVTVFYNKKGYEFKYGNTDKIKKKYTPKCIILKTLTQRK